MIGSRACAFMISPRNDDYTDTESYPSVCFDASAPKDALFLLSGPGAYARNGKSVSFLFVGMILLIHRIGRIGRRERQARTWGCCESLR